jgi:hypothetical protein
LLIDIEWNRKKFSARIQYCRSVGFGKQGLFCWLIGQILSMACWVFNECILKSLITTLYSWASTLQHFSSFMMEYSKVVCRRLRKEVARNTLSYILQTCWSSTQNDTYKTWPSSDKHLDLLPHVEIPLVAFAFVLW